MPRPSFKISVLQVYIFKIPSRSFIPQKYWFLFYLSLQHVTKIYKFYVKSFTHYIILQSYRNTNSSPSCAFKPHKILLSIPILSSTRKIYIQERNPFTATPLTLLKNTANESTGNSPHSPYYVHTLPLLYFHSHSLNRTNDISVRILLTFAHL